MKCLLINIFKILSFRIKFNRNEFSGAFGDIGTDLPLLVGVIVAGNLDCASVLIMFGLMQLITSLTYGIPVPVQPLKAVAAIVIANNISGNIIYASGLAIGIIMLLLTVTGLVSIIARIIPKAVIRGIQLGMVTGIIIYYLSNNKIKLSIN